MCIAVISNGVRLNAKMVIMSSSCTIDTSPSEKITNSISRGVLITDRFVLLLLFHLTIFFVYFTYYSTFVDTQK